MPYIDEDLRKRLDNYIRDLVVKIHTDINLKQKLEGVANYCISRFLYELILYDQPLSYANINKVMGILSCVEHEFYRRVAAEYEDKKALINGDVFIRKFGEDI
ncbi:MAG: hypothetical protein DRI44_09145 [Chlamydiae bacterium]|nr:MAG: hypothetical protein DRI44_09145 [Chlamydiota bacterium]